MKKRDDCIVTDFQISCNTWITLTARHVVTTAGWFQNSIWLEINSSCVTLFQGKGGILVHNVVHNGWFKHSILLKKRAFSWTSSLFWTLTSSWEQILFDKSRVAMSAFVSDDNIVSFLWRRQAPWDGKIKDFKLELVSFSQWRCWCALSTGQSRSPWPWSPTFASDDIHTGLTCGLSWSPFLCTSSIFSSSHVFLPPLDCFWHEASGWAENMWENITRVFTGAEKAGQTNHLSLYCSTFPSQTLQCFNAECCKMIECI